MGSAAAAGLTVSHATLRVISPSVPAGGYFELANASATPVTLLGARSAVCSAVMLHESSTEGGMARMDDIGALVVPAHGKISFAPGGRHLMCMDPAASLLTSRIVPIVLEFRDAPALAVPFAVTDALGRAR
ncbi:MAG TPA: copper chaperone PCu(A)C [Rhizomicrobium sp.]